MPSVHKRKGSPYWWAAYYRPDGRRAFRSTKQTNRAKAQKICHEYADAADLGKQGRLSEKQARRVIAHIYHIANADALRTPSVKKYLEDWLAAKRLTLAPGSLPEYANAVTGFLEHLGARTARSIDAVTTADVTSYRAARAATVAGATVNKTLKILKGAWAAAAREGIVRENVFGMVAMVRSKKSERRAFTLPELRRILEKASPEWRGIILTGLYTGQRLGDVARLTWQSLDLDTGELRLTTGKTGRNMIIPIAQPLLEYFIQLPATDDPTAPLFPKAAATPGATLSNRFTDLLNDVGLIEKPETHNSTGKGRSASRRVGGLSFHCIRHTATSLLKNAGVSDVIAREIIGHSSEAVSRAYTHIETSTLRTAIEKLPDITAVSTKKTGDQKR